MDRSVSDRFFTEIEGSHTMYSYIDAVSPTQNTIRLKLIDGSVTVDRTAAVRRHLTATCIDDTGLLVPGDIGDILTPFGTYLYPYRGVIYDDTIEVVPLGVFRLAKSSVKDSDSGLIISLEAYDLSRTVTRDKLTVPLVIPVGTNIVTAIQTLLNATFANLEYNVIGTTRVTTTPLVYDAQTDPWDAATQLATSLGCDLYFDTRGGVVLQPPTDIESLPAPDFSYVEGLTCGLLDVERTFTDEPGYNGVVVTGEAPGDNAAPVRAIAWDVELSSITYHLGPYGEVPMFFSDSTIKTVQDAQDTANQLLKNQLGFSSQVNINTVVNPAFEAGDVVQVVREKSKVNDIFSLDAFTVPLGPTGAQQLSLRQKRRRGI